MLCFTTVKCIVEIYIIEKKKGRRKKWSETEEINDFKGKHGEIRTARGKQKMTNAHLTTATVIAKEYDFNLSSTENLKRDPWTA